MPAKTLYQILEVPTDANERQIKRAYHTMAKRYHPDKASSPEETKQFEEQMAAISQAYNVLKDASRRAEYDASLKSSRRSPGEQSAPGTTPAPRRPSSGGVATPPEKSKAGTTDARRAQISQKALAKGIQLLQAGDPQKALEFLEAAVANNGDDAVAHAKLAEAMLQCGRSLSRATSHAERAIELDSWNIQHRLTLARLYERAGVASRALAAYEEVLRWEPGNPEAQAKIKQIKRGPSGGSSLAGILGRLFKRGE